MPSLFSQQKTTVLAFSRSPQLKLTHRTSRPDRETSPDSQSLLSYLCHFLTDWLNPSSCLPPAGVSTTHQMAQIAWKTFTLSVWTWQSLCQAFTYLSPVWRWHSGSVVSTVISQQQGSELVSVWTFLIFALCLCWFTYTNKSWRSDKMCQRLCNDCPGQNRLVPSQLVSNNESKRWQKGIWAQGICWFWLTQSKHPAWPNNPDIHWQTMSRWSY